MSDSLKNLSAEQIDKGNAAIAYTVSECNSVTDILKGIQYAAQCSVELAMALWEEWKTQHPKESEYYEKVISGDLTPTVLLPEHPLDYYKKLKHWGGMHKGGMQQLLSYAAPVTHEQAQAILKAFHLKFPELSNAFEKYKKEVNTSFDEKLDAPVSGLTEPESKSKSLGLDFQLKKPTEAQTAAMAKEEAKDEKFDLSKFIPDMEMKETVKSSGSANVYALVASHGSSKVGVSVTLNPTKVGSEIHLHLLCRFLEVPLDGVSAFPNPGETRVYLKDGEPCEVFMLAKFNWKLCNAQCSPWEVRSHLEAGVKDQVTAFIWRLLEERGCAINCTDLQDLQNVLFVRLDQLPDSPALYWENLGDDTPGSL